MQVLIDRYPTWYVFILSNIKSLFMKGLISTVHGNQKFHSCSTQNNKGNYLAYAYKMSRKKTLYIFPPYLIPKISYWRTISTKLMAAQGKNKDGIFNLGYSNRHQGLLKKLFFNYIGLNLLLIFLILCFQWRGDIIEVDTWVGSHGKNGMRRDWHIRDYNSGQTILRATRHETHSFYIFYIISMYLFSINELLVLLQVAVATCLSCY